MITIRWKHCLCERQLRKISGTNSKGFFFLFLFCCSKLLLKGGEGGRTKTYLHSKWLFQNLGIVILLIKMSHLEKKKMQSILCYITKEVLHMIHTHIQSRSHILNIMTREFKKTKQKTEDSVIMGNFFL